MLQLLLIKRVWLCLILWVWIVELASWLISVVDRPGLSDDVFLELLIGIMRVAVQRGALFQVLEDVDHCLIYILLLYLAHKQQWKEQKEDIKEGI